MTQPNENNQAEREEWKEEIRQFFNNQRLTYESMINKFLELLDEV